MKEIRTDAARTVIRRSPASIFKYDGWPSICRGPDNRVSVWEATEKVFTTNIEADFDDIPALEE